MIDDTERVSPPFKAVAASTDGRGNPTTPKPVWPWSDETKDCAAPGGASGENGSPPSDFAIDD